MKKDIFNMLQLWLVFKYFPSTHNLNKKIVPLSGPTKWSGSNLFDTQMVFLKEFYEEVDFEKNQQTTKKIKIKNYP